MWSFNKMDTKAWFCTILLYSDFFTCTKPEAGWHVPKVQCSRQGFGTMIILPPASQFNAEARLGGSVEWASDWWSGGWGFDPCRVGYILSWKLIMKYFLLEDNSFEMRSLIFSAKKEQKIRMLSAAFVLVLLTKKPMCHTLVLLWAVPVNIFWQCTE